MPNTSRTTPLRQRMIEDMTFRNMSPSTMRVYTYAVANFARYHHKSPDQLGLEDVRHYRLHLLSRGLKAKSINPIVGGLRFFSSTTLGNRQLAEQIPFARVEETLPAVLSRDQIIQLLRAEPDLRMRTIFIVIYAAGLRISEVVKLTAADINSRREVIHVREGKGAKDRFIMLSEQLPRILRHYWPTRNAPGDLLFPGESPGQPITTRTVQRAFRETADRAGLPDKITPHTLRHSFATHLLEQGVDIRVIQQLLGHRNLNSTARYAQVAINMIRQIQSPLELLNVKMSEAQMGGRRPKR